MHIDTGWSVGIEVLSKQVRNHPIRLLTSFWQLQTLNRGTPCEYLPSRSASGWARHTLYLEWTRPSNFNRIHLNCGFSLCFDNDKHLGCSLNYNQWLAYLVSQLTSDWRHEAHKVLAASSTKCCEVRACIIRSFCINIACGCFLILDLTIKSDMKMCYNRCILW
jgi:hypothetical protein